VPGTYQEVDAARARAQTSANLLTSAVTPNSPDNRWMSGFSFLGEMCPEIQLYNPCDDLSTEPDGDLSEPTYVQPMAYRMRQECSLLGNEFERAGQRLRRMTEAVGSFAVARELWTGVGTSAEPFPSAAPNGQLYNPFLADANAEVLTGAGNALDAIGLLEQEARERTGGQQVTIHVPIRVATRIAAQLQRVGNELRTYTDAIVVADGGYPGSGPTDGGTRNVQTVTITGAPTGGSFTLTRLGHTTAAIPWNATAVQVTNAINAAGAGPVTTTGTGPYVVTATNAGPVALMTATPSFTGGTTPGVNVVNTTPGVAPAPQAGVWAYATGPVIALLGPIAEVSEMPYTVDRRTNRRTVWADRMFAASFDPCCQLAIQIPAAT
jgi:hypothetical protein